MNPLSIFVGILLLAVSGCGGGGSSSSAGAPATGKPGSLSRFAIVGERLYTLESQGVQVFDIRRPADPQRQGSSWVGWGVETLGAYDNLLLIGAADGLYIYDTVNPDNPRMLSRLLHARAQDPVVARGNVAFLTLSGNLNQLDVIDIANPASPRLLRSYPMRRPTGLGVDGNLLFLCDGEDGLKVFDVSDPLNLRELDRQRELRPKDLIAQDSLLITTTATGVAQYSYSPLPLRFLSNLSF